MPKIASNTEPRKPLELVTLDLEKPSRDKDGRYNLNDLHRMAGLDANKRPGEWSRTDATKALAEVLQIQQNANCGKSRICEVMVSKRGNNGGTWAILSLALAYTKFLSPEFHAQALQVLVERIEEQADPELGITRAKGRAVSIWKRTKTADWIAARLAGVDTRNQFTSACAERGVKDYRLVTNGIYVGLFGKTARELRVMKALPEGTNVRDKMDETELISTRLAENLAIRRVQAQKLWGDDEIASAANHCGRGVQQAVSNALGGAA